MSLCSPLPPSPVTSGPSGKRYSTNQYRINIYQIFITTLWCAMHTLVVLIAGGLRVLETQHVNRRTEGVPALARLSGVTAGRGALAGPDARSGMRTSRWYSAVIRQPSRRMYISNSSTAASPVPCRAHSRTSYLSGSSRELRSSEGEAQPRAAAGDMGRGLRAVGLTCACRRARCHRRAPSRATWPKDPRPR